MDGYEKTQHLQLNKIGKKNIADILAVSENFETLDEAIGNMDLEVTDTKVICTVSNKETLDKVLKKLLDKDFSSFATKGKILPPDIKNATKLVTEVTIASDGTVTVTGLNSSGKITTTNITALKTLIYNNRGGITNNKIAINGIEIELNGKTDRIKQYNDIMDVVFK